MSSPTQQTKYMNIHLVRGLDFPGWKITSDIKIGQNKLEKESSSDSLKSFARLNIYYKPEFLSSIRYGVIFLRAYINEYSYDIDNNDFRENSITTGLNIQY